VEREELRGARVGVEPAFKRLRAGRASTAVFARVHERRPRAHLVDMPLKIAIALKDLADHGQELLAAFKHASHKHAGILIAWPHTLRHGSSQPECARTLASVVDCKMPLPAARTAAPSANIILFRSVGTRWNKRYIRDRSACGCMCGGASAVRNARTLRPTPSRHRTVILAVIQQVVEALLSLASTARWRPATQDCRSRRARACEGHLYELLRDVR
jgi:hypothetical protein